MAEFQASVSRTEGLIQNSRRLVQGWGLSALPGISGWASAQGRVTGASPGDATFTGVDLGKDLGPRQKREKVACQEQGGQSGGGR